MSNRTESGRIRIVIDTVGFVRAMIGPSGVWGDIVFRYAKRIETILCEQMVVEIARVMTYPKVARRLESPAAASMAALDEVIRGATFVRVTDVPSVCRDPGDDIVLATARAADANFILSEDRDLLDLVEYEGIPIVTGLELLQILRESE